MRVVIAVLLILALTTLLFFVAINSATAPVNLFFLLPVRDYPVGVVALVSLVIGVLFASIVGIVEGARLRLQNHQLRSKLKRLEGELRSLRGAALPPPDPEGRVDEQSAL